MAWFDKKDTAPGVLTNIISEDITLLNGLTTETISIFLEAIFCMVIGIVLSLFFSWKISLITLALTPFLILGGYLRGKLMNKERTEAAEQDDPYK